MKLNSDLRQRAESVMRKAVSIARMDAAKRAKHDSAQSDLILYLQEIEGTALRKAAE